MRFATPALALALATGSFLTFAAGCHDDEVCNPGLMLQDGVCVPPSAPKDAAAPDASADAGSGDDGDDGDGPAG
jgi:hypothetical protein